MAEESEESQSQAGAKKAGGNKVLPILLIMNTLLLGGVLMFVMKKGSSPSGSGGGSGEKSEEPAAAGITLKLDTFVVHLKSVDQDRYLKIGFDLDVVGGEPDKTAVLNRMAPIRDSILTYLSDRTADELKGSDGLERAKAAVLKKIDEIVPKRVRGVYITEFIVQ